MHRSVPGSPDGRAAHIGRSGRVAEGPRTRLRGRSGPATGGTGAAGRRGVGAAGVAGSATHKLGWVEREETGLDPGRDKVNGGARLGTHSPPNLPEPRAQAIIPPPGAGP